MADKKLTLIVQAKNAVAQGFSSALDSVKNFGAMAGRALGTVSKWAGIAASALGGISFAGAIKEYAAQEKADRQLTEALRLHGDAVDQLMPKYQAVAAAIQDQTGFGDDATITIMAQARMYGVTADKLEDAAKGTIALTRAGMGQDMAVRALAAAHEGNYTALTRYIPALKSVTDESEKAAVVNDFLSKQYAASKGDLDTVAGRWAALKGRIGDALEEVGAAIAQNGMLNDVLAKAGDWVKRLGDRIKDWVGGGGVTRMIAGMMEFAENARHGFKQTLNYGNLAWSGLKDGFATAWNYVGNLFSANIDTMRAGFQLIVDFAVAAFNKIKNPFSEFVAPDTGPFVDAMKKQLDAAMGKDALVIDSSKKAWEAIDRETERHVKRGDEILDWEVKQFKSKQADKVDAAEEAEEQIVVAARNTAKELEELTKKQADIEKKMAEESERLHKEAWDKRKAALEEEIAAKEKLAKQTVEGFLAEKRAAEDREKQIKNDADRQAKLEAKQGRGTKLSRKDAERLAAQQHIAGARAALPGLNNHLDVAKANLDARNKQGKTLNDMLKDLQKIQNQQAALLAMG